MIEATFRSLPTWPYKPTWDRRSRYTFKAPWSNTLSLLQKELGYLGATNIVIGCGLRDYDIRIDGWPRANAKLPSHPGVEVSFDTLEHGRLTYATDVCEFWEHNVRAIALGLEALRAVDRHGITKSGQQYAGFRALPAAGESTLTRGAELVREHGSVKAALSATHPDHGGDPDDFHAVMAHRENGA